jgi:Transposase DDE domain
MAASPGNEITFAHPEGRFFLGPEKATHRQYEALRAYFVEGLPSSEAAQRFGYTAGSFRVLCHRFRRESRKAERFFKDIVHGPQAPPVRDLLRERVITLRKQNFSVYDMQRELRKAGHEVSINTLSVILQEEGFARLPRRRDEERPSVPAPEVAPVADVRALRPEPRSFRTRFAGLFFFIPLMEGIDLAGLARRAELPGSKMIPAAAALRSVLALKLARIERTSHVMPLVLDQGLALFAGLNALPKRSWFATYSARVGGQRNQRLMALWFDEVQQGGLSRSGSFDVDFHSVPANPTKEPLQKHYVSKRSRSQQAVLVFLARDAEEHVLCYGNAAVDKKERAGEVVRFAEFYRQRTGSYPQELVFDSQLTTYEKLDWLRQEGIHFLTLRRRSRKMLARIYQLPPSRWSRVTLRSLARKYRTPRVLDEPIRLSAYQGEIRQLSVIDLGHEEPTILLTNDFKRSPATLITRYARRMLIENGIAEAIHFFHLDALSSMVDLKVDFDLQITLMGSALYRMFAERLPEDYRRAQAKTLFKHLLDVGGRIDITEREVVVTLDKRAHNPILAETGFIDRPTPMPWFFDKMLRLRLP